VHSVILYELNEVPWEVVDRYVEHRPGSQLGRLLPEAQQTTTVNEDPVTFQPWRTWPTFHTSSYTSDHNSYDLGQDPTTFRGVTLWDAADAAGRKVGLFGPMQSWPAKQFANGGFHVPDTFSRDAGTEPPALRRFQSFNLAMTRENGFASDARLSVLGTARVGVDILTKGLTPASAYRTGAHLVRERLDRQYTARRSIVQVLPAFDLYWRLHRTHRPDLSVFFTNHVAGMMHRFWGDWEPAYAKDEGYTPNDVYATFIPTAMDYFDDHLRRMRRWVDSHPGTVLIIASSMGQGPVPYRGDVRETYVLEDPTRLLSALQLSDGALGLAMYPRISFDFRGGDTSGAAATLATVTIGDGLMFSDIHVQGTTVSCSIEFPRGASELPRAVSYLPAGGTSRTDADIAALGIVVRSRPGGANTAYHVPEGIFVAYGDGIVPDESRHEVSVLDAAPSILGVLGVEPPAQMQGTSSIFV
jgi:hypothetical protein